jgi:Arc/MetJ family transcription regulator
MKTNIEINEDAIRDIMRLSKAKNKKQAIEKSLHDFLRYLHKLDMLKLKGKVRWEGNLDEMRSI